MLSIFWSQQSDGHVSRGQLLDTFMQSFIKACQQGCSSRHHYRVIKSFPHVDVAFLDRVDDHLVHSGPLQPDLVWTEQDLRSLEFLLAQLDDLTVRQMIVGHVFLLPLLVLLIVLTDGDRDITLHLLDLLYDFKFSRRVEHVTRPP